MPDEFLTTKLAELDAEIARLRDVRERLARVIYDYRSDRSDPDAQRADRSRAVVLATPRRRSDAQRLIDRLRGER